MSLQKKFLKENGPPIVNDYFRFKSLDEIEEVEKQFTEWCGFDDEDGFVDSDKRWQMIHLVKPNLECSYKNK